MSMIFEISSLSCLMKKKKFRVPASCLILAFRFCIKKFVFVVIIVIVRR
jgi:hypothetical protein